MHTKSENSLVKITHEHGPVGFVFFAAYIGAVVYFYNLSPDFWGFIVALFKAIFWPGFLVYQGLLALGA